MGSDILLHPVDGNAGVVTSLVISGNEGVSTMSDIWRTKRVVVEIQENGSICDSTGWGMGKLGDDYPFEDVFETPLKWRELPFVNGFVIGGAALIAFLLGTIIGYLSATSGCV